MSYHSTRSLLLALFCSTGLLLAQTPGAPLKLVESARRQVGVTKTYDAAYVALSYPGGDVPVDRGVCTDVVIRAFREAFRMDLQQLVHEDMQKSFAAYPHQWGLAKPDKNIDHRRVPNLQTWFTRQGMALKVSADPADFRAGDLVTVVLPGHLPHIMIVSDRKSADEVPLVIHNIGGGAQEEDGLLAYPMTGHYRLAK